MMPSDTMLRSARLSSVLTAALLVPAVAAAQTAPTPPAEPPAAAPGPASDAGWHPAREADPPLLPPPTGLPPLSTSGTDVAPAERDGAPVVVGAGDPSLHEARLRALEDRVRVDARRLRELEERASPWRNLTVGGFVQPQLLVQSANTAGSPNLLDGALPSGIGPNDIVARPDGTTTNGTLFRLRRTRLRTTFETKEMRLYVQLEAMPLTGEAPTPSTLIRNAEATGKIRWTDDVRTEVTAGLFMVPFRYELTETSNVRPFIERTAFVQNVFPLERDLGVHAKTTALDGKLVVDVSIVNGSRLGEPTFVALPDLNRSKDVVGWLSYELGPATIGVNGYVGRGQIVDGESLRFKQFGRWAMNYFAVARWPVLRALGETRLLAELTVSENMDAGLRYPQAVPRIPASFTADVTDVGQRAFYVRLEQELTRWALAGYRYDFYVPDASIANNGRDTHSFLAVARISRNLRWMNELFYAIDNVHARETAPPSKHLVGFSTVLQGEF